MCIYGDIWKKRERERERDHLPMHLRWEKLDPLKFRSKAWNFVKKTSQKSSKSFPLPKHLTAPVQQGISRNPIHPGDPPVTRGDPGDSEICLLALCGGLWHLWRGLAGDLRCHQTWQWKM